jgi:chaperone modulatory protein CbpM
MKARDMKTQDVVAAVRIEAEILEQWVESGWLMPQHSGSDPQFSEIDLARAHLIRDLRNLGANDESIPLILDLIDQLHGVRRVLHEVLSSIKERETR